MAHGRYLSPVRRSGVPRLRPPVATLEDLVNRVAPRGASPDSVAKAFRPVLREKLHFPFVARSLRRGPGAWAGPVTVEALHDLSVGAYILVAVRKSGVTWWAALEELEPEERVSGADWLYAYLHAIRHWRFRTQYRGRELGGDQMHRCARGRQEESAWCIGELMYSWQDSWSDPRRLPECVSPTIAGFLRSWWERLERLEAERLIGPLLSQLPGTRGTSDGGTERRLRELVLAWASGSREWAWVRLNASGRFEEEVDRLALPDFGEMRCLPQRRSPGISRPPTTHLRPRESLRVGASAARREARRIGAAVPQLPTRELRREANDRATRYSAFAAMLDGTEKGVSRAITASLERSGIQAPGDALRFGIEGGPPGGERTISARVSREGATTPHRSTPGGPGGVATRPVPAVEWVQFCRAEGEPKALDRAYVLASLSVQNVTVDAVRNGQRKEAGAIAEATAIRVTKEFLEPTVLEIQRSAVELVESMIRISRETDAPVIG